MNTVQIVVPDTASILEAAKDAALETVGGYTAVLADGGWIRDDGTHVLESVRVLTLAGDTLPLSTAIGRIARILSDAGESAAYIQGSSAAEIATLSNVSNVVTAAAALGFNAGAIRYGWTRSDVLESVEDAAAAVQDAVARRIQAESHWRGLVDEFEDDIAALVQAASDLERRPGFHRDTLSMKPFEASQAEIEYVEAETASVSETFDRLSDAVLDLHQIEDEIERLREAEALTIRAARDVGVSDIELDAALNGR